MGLPWLGASERRTLRGAEAYGAFADEFLKKNG